MALVAAGIAWRVGGGADDAVPPPRPDAAVSQAVDGAASEGGAGAAVGVAGGQGATPEGYEVALRLLDHVKDARIEDPRGASTARALSVHWRKMRPVWLPPPGAAARSVTTLALRTSAMEMQWSMPTAGGKAWAPDAKIWNMNEGSFEQRDALVAATPSSFAFKVTVPAGARLTFAEGTLNATRETTVFAVTVVDARGATHEVYRHRLGPAAARRWTEASCDLAAFAGQSVELRLSAEESPATAEERHALARHREEVARAIRKATDAGVGPVDAGARATASAAGRPGSESGPGSGPGSGSGSGSGSEPKSGTGTFTGESADAGTDGGAPREEVLLMPGAPVVLWGNPTVLARVAPRVPYNILWIVIDALRPDVLASFHDDAEDAARLAAPNPPLEALLPKIPGLTPAIDDLSRRGVRFTRAYSGGAWTRPGTLSMLSGARSSELGVDTLHWVLKPGEAARFYASAPPLLPLTLRQKGVATHAFVNNYFMAGYAPVGVDMGFEHVADHRYRTRDTLEVTQGATAWLRAHRDTRFFLFVNYDSPHEPYEPPPQLLARVPPPPAGPADKTSRLYMAEAAKDDEAVGVLMQTLAEIGQLERTIVVLTADHGETLSSAHGGTSGLDRMPVRYHHAVSNFEETTRVPILIVAPGLLPPNVAVAARVRNVDIVPTLNELLGLEPHPRTTGLSMVGLARGQKEADERVVISEGRGTVGVLHGRHRLLLREGLARTTHHPDRTVTVGEELFDLVDDPGERRDLAATSPDRVAELRARLAAANSHVAMAGTHASVATSADATKPPVLHLRFVGGGKARRVSGTIQIGSATAKPTSFTVEPVEMGRDAFKIDDKGRVDLAFHTSPQAPVGVDVVVEPAGIPVSWKLFLDDAAFPVDAVFGGPYGIVAPLLAEGVTTEEARSQAAATFLPSLDPRRDTGLFVIRERLRDPSDPAGETGETDESAEEMARLLREWGYAHGPAAAPRPP